MKTQDCPLCKDTYHYLEQHLIEDHKAKPKPSDGIESYLPFGAPWGNKKEEYQGHHCTGKCTKLEENINKSWGEVHMGNKKEKECEHQIYRRDDGAFVCLKCFPEAKTEKECEHNWIDFKESTNIPNIKSQVCTKCYKINHTPKQSEPFWLKEKDVIKIHEGLVLGNNDDRWSLPEGRPLVGRIKEINDRDQTIVIHWITPGHPTDYGRFLHTFDFLSPKRFKKIKLVSPALYKVSRGWALTLYLYSEKPEINETEQIIWPAKDQFGREIWYEVEE